MTNTSRSLGASAVALALAASAFAAPSAFAQEADAVAPIESGAVNWPIKESFNAYIGSAGEITVTDGVVRDGNSFDFTVNAEESELDAEGNGVIELDGTIHYYAHGGGLDLTYDDVKVVVEGTDAKITADLSLTGQRPGQDPVETEEDDAEIASFTLENALVPAENETLTESERTTTFLDGAAIAGYTPGEVVDGGDIDIEITFGEIPEEPGSFSPGKSSQSSNDPLDSSKGSSAENHEGDSDDAGIIAVIVALLAAVGAAGAAVGGFIPGFDINQILKQFGL
ncbi:HtaA domain-containing protein [Corynebacterium sp.]|uniref:HtaA domain-containing protein n=1 Tax=Corynebacterium sp. TaxID=1720 RepID=UPI0028B2675D|nr:HtaA domain-containing protein [Corynebacterium sp.]